VQFTIESRELTTQSNPRNSNGAEPTWTMINADTADDAIFEFVRQNHSELVSFLRPAECRESIGTVRKDEAVFLVRVYEA
jgi:hypothetical protein